MTDDGNRQTASQPSRRDFLTMATCGMTAVTVGAGVWGLVGSMSPSASIVARPELRIDLSEVPVGEQRIYMLDRQPVFVRHLTEDEIAKAVAFDVEELGDGLARNANLLETAKATVENRTISSNGVYTVLWGTCPSRRWGSAMSNYDVGWFCIRDAAHYDVFGRIYRGYGENMKIPRYQLVQSGVLVVSPDQGGPSQQDLDRLVFGSQVANYSQ